MLRGSRRDILAVGLSALAAITIAFFLWRSASERHLGYQQTANHYASQYANEGRIEAKNCVTLPVPERAKCQGEAEETARNGQRDEHDLEAQRITAVWTQHMGLAAIVAMVVSIVGVGLVWTTFRATRQAASTSDMTYSAFIALERPTLVVKIGKPRINMMEWVEFDVGVTNIGKSACVVTMSVAAWRATNKFDEVKGYTGTPQHVFVAGAATTNIAVMRCKLENLKTKPIIGGIIKYRSPLKEDHKAFFCFRLVEDGEGDRLKFHVIDMKGDDWPKDE